MTRMRILVVGAGSIGERHVRCFLQTGRVDITLCEINAEVRERVAREYELSEVFDDFHQAVQSSPSAAVICTPAHLHIEMATPLAERGIDLLIEKPLSTSLEGVPALEAAVSSQQVVAGVAYVYRAHPLLQSMRAA